MITLHQILHGYKLGHNYIQGSIVLPSLHDMDKIATLSDWSEYVGINNERDYITAYPLDESPYYVVAMTWYADGMRRPGCVWTHSLLIHNDDLAKINDFCNLLYLFEVPRVENNETYSKPRAFVEDAKEANINLSEIGENRVAEVYESLLSSSPTFILSELTSHQSQTLLLTLMNYVPTEILKNKSMCSGTAAPRAYDGRYLSLQFVTHDGNAIKYLANKTTAPWSQLVGVSMANNKPQLASLIRHYQDELGDSVEKLSGFLNVLVLINRVCKDDEEKQLVLLEIINTLSQTFPKPEDGQMFKSAVFQPSLARDFGGEENFLYTISTVNVDSFTEEQVEYGNRLHNLSTSQFLRLLKRLYTSEQLNKWGIKTVNEVAQYISYAEIANLSQTDKAFFLTIISNSPELLNQVVWADLSSEELQATLAIFSDKNMVNAFNHWKELLKTMFEQKVPVASELAHMAFSHDRDCVGEYLTYLNSEKHQPQRSVLMELKYYPEAVLDWLSKVTSINFDVACVLVNSIDEFNVITKNKGSRIWMPFHNVLTEKAPVRFYIYLYRLSFNWQDKESLIYLRKAFYPIHQLLAQDKLGYSFWYRIEPYTEHLFFFQNWDKCKKLRKMVIRRMKEAGCFKSELANYTPDHQTNEWLLKEW